MNESKEEVIEINYKMRILSIFFSILWFGCAFIIIFDNLYSDVHCYNPTFFYLGNLNITLALAISFITIIAFWGILYAKYAGWANFFYSTLFSYSFLALMSIAGRCGVY